MSNERLVFQLENESFCFILEVTHIFLPLSRYLSVPIFSWIAWSYNVVNNAQNTTTRGTKLDSPEVSLVKQTDFSFFLTLWLYTAMVSLLNKSIVTASISTAVAIDILFWSSSHGVSYI